MIVCSSVMDQQTYTAIDHYTHYTHYAIQTQTQHVTRANTVAKTGMTWISKQSEIKATFAHYLKVTIFCEY